MALVSGYLWLDQSKKANSEPIVANVAAYEKAIKDSQALSKTGMAKFESGEALDPDDKVAIQKAIDKLEGAVKFNPTRFTTYSIIGKLNLALEKDTEAEQAFLQAINLVPIDITKEEKIVMASTHADLARMAILRTQYGPAELYAQKAVEFAPNLTIGYTTLARVRIQQNRIPEAKKLIEKAFELNPQDLETRDLIKLIKLAKRN